VLYQQKKTADKAIKEEYNADTMYKTSDYPYQMAHEHREYRKVLEKEETQATE
jgi:hypothetical protein